jgi:hypothetical protein
LCNLQTGDRPRAGRLPKAVKNIHE